VRESRSRSPSEVAGIPAPAARRSAANLKRVALVVVAAAVIAPNAAAHARDRWYWNAELAMETLTTSSRVPDAFNAVSVSDVGCQSIGIWIRGKDRAHRKLYKHFECHFRVNFEDGSSKRVERILHVISARDFVLSTI
jgi:hypothetical protein